MCSEQVLDAWKGLRAACQSDARVAAAETRALLYKCLKAALCSFSSLNNNKPFQFVTVFGAALSAGGVKQDKIINHLK